MAFSSSSESPIHVVILPFMAKGHTIPLLHLTHLFFLRRSNIAVTIFTTHANSQFIRQSLHDTKALIIELTFPQNFHPEIPQGVESVDKLPSQSLLVPFCKGTKNLQPEFDTILQSLRPNVSCLISDVFFPWSMEIAAKLNIPRLDFDGASNFAMVFYDILMTQEFPVDSDDELFSVIPSLPDIKLTKNDIEPEFSHPQPGEHTDFYTEVVMAMSKSKGIIRNSFYELEPEFVDYWNKEKSPKAWNIGPLCLLATKVVCSEEKPMCIQWLDEKLEKGESVLYVAFGSLAEMTMEQLREIAIGLENSGEHFLWVLRLPEPSTGDEFMSEFEERVKGRGLLVKNQWVDQVAILSHESVNGFMSHCGWNSVLESICESVPLLGFPITADQNLNARMVEEYFKIGVKVVTRNGSVRGFFSSKCIENKVKELMDIEGEKGKEMRKNVNKLNEKARNAMVEGGSSWRTLNLLIDEVICNKN
ncbi:hypothetical protein MKW98_014082 [Papaver atlanticum]|uniref:Glycosyltransferase n=1 Tax=Papaver atlanticum TaxID=357466 RepID=A0AAD4SLK7_9MAGN|nr:hypothetical protein MKW98_014082 [Papaver atlanticum]